MEIGGRSYLFDLIWHYANLFKNLPAELRVRIHRILLEDYFEPVGSRPRMLARRDVPYRQLLRRTSRRKPSPPVPEVTRVAQRSYRDVNSLDFSNFPPPCVEYDFAYDMNTFQNRIFEKFLIPNIRRFKPFRGLCIDFLSTVCAHFQIRVHDVRDARDLVGKIADMDRIIPGACYRLNVALVVQNGATVFGNASVAGNIPSLPPEAISMLTECIEILVKLPEHFRLHLHFAYPWFEYQELNAIAVETGFAKRVDAIYVREGYPKAFLYHAPTDFTELETFHQQQVLAAICDIDPPAFEALKDEVRREALERAGVSGFYGVKRSGTTRVPRRITPPDPRLHGDSKADDSRCSSTGTSERKRSDC